MAEQWSKLQAWFARAPGTLLLEQERAELTRQLPYKFGYYLLHLGPVSAPGLLDASKIARRAHLGYRGACPEDMSVAVEADADALPIAAESVDLVILHHLLEFHPHPHDVLREVDRILIAEGQVVILTLNPFSLWGLWRLALAWRDEPPWSGRFYSCARIRDWCALLGFEIVDRRWLYFRPPARRERVNRRLEFLDRLGAYGWPRTAAVHVVVAKKRVVPITPRLAFSRKRKSVLGGVAEPTIRESEPTWS